MLSRFVWALLLPIVAFVCCGGSNVWACSAAQRALVLYDNKLCVLEDGTCLNTFYLMKDRYSKIIGKLPTNVWVVQAFSFYGDGKTNEIVALTTPSVEKIRVQDLRHPLTSRIGDPRDNFSLTQDGHLKLAPGKPADNRKWRKTPIRFRPMHDDYSAATYVIEYISDNRSNASFISVSNKTIEIKDRRGEPMTLYPLVLGERKDAVEFMCVDFSGK
jgi:hypothetical protein